MRRVPNSVAFGNLTQPLATRSVETLRRSTRKERTIRIFSTACGSRRLRGNLSLNEFGRPVAFTVEKRLSFFGSHINPFATQSAPPLSPDGFYSVLGFSRLLRLRARAPHVQIDGREASPARAIQDRLFRI